MNTTSVAELHALAQAVFQLSFNPREDERLESRVRMACNPMMDGDAGPAFTTSHPAALNFISQLLSLRADELDRLRPSYCAALAIEAQRAETVKQGSVEDESAGPQDNAQ